MSATQLLNEARRVMGICNACRYCEGFCAVFPAMERRRTFTDQDLKYLANLCHNCRGCYYACQYAPPHEFGVNVSRTLAELKLETYQEFSWPGSLRGLLKRNAAAIALMSLAAVILILAAILIWQGPSAVFSRHLGEGAFYRVLPFWVMVLPFSVLTVFILAAFTVAVVRFWREIGGRGVELVDPVAHAATLWDVFRLRYLAGGGDGCNYPDDRFSLLRRRLHHCVFYGFGLCLASTSVAAGYHHFFRWVAPYPYLSWPVALGTIGGLALLVGTTGLLRLKGKMDARPSAADALSLDVALLVLLFLTSLTGLALLVLRETPAMGILLVVHLGIVLALFVMLPYGKFLHAVYGYAALLRNAIEKRRETAELE